jgi:hypothetical protein
MNKYAQYTPQQLEELFSHFLIDSWSYSKVSTFARNEKDFERRYVYREQSRKSSSAVAGSSYHAAVEYFFRALMEGRKTTVVDMKAVAYDYIDNVPANDWRIQKTTPTVDSCTSDATKKANAYIDNFLKEIDVYELEKIKRIIGVEMPITQWLTINGVDIPLPCHAVLDLAVEHKDGKVIIIDHKGKSAFTSENEIALTTGKQAITYVRALEAATGILADEVWFVENKHSANKDGQPQLRASKVEVTKDTIKLYEALLYEPLKRMLEAISDPDYVYMINDTDTMAERAELYNFWAKTMIAEVDDFNIPEEKRPLIIARLKKIRDASLSAINPKVINTFKKNAAAFITYDLSMSDMTNSEKIEHSLRTFGVLVRVAHEIQGYSSDTYLMEASTGTKIANIYNYRLDIANALNVSSVRIGKNLMIYGDKSYLYIEVSKKRNKDLLFDPAQLTGQRLPIGVDNFGRTIVWDLENHATPHMLICGATGSGKSVSIISTVEYALLAGINDIHIMDPKYEFTSYAGKKGIKVYNDITEIEKAMAELVADMQKRAKTGRSNKTLVVFDEFADAVSAARSGAQLDIKEEVVDGYYKNGNPRIKMVTVGRDKSLEENLKILLQKGRSIGFRIIGATQRASVQVITGDAKVNFPVVVCFRVPKEIDSKVVLDEPGAETLAGMGDGMMRSPEYFDIVRFQGFYKS